jgi:predicted small lipoprotein YifL
MSESACRTRRAALALLATALLGACGKKGTILPPEGQKDAYKRTVYPDPASVVPGGQAGLGPTPPELNENEFGRTRTTTTTIQSE